MTRRTTDNEGTVWHLAEDQTADPALQEFDQLIECYFGHILCFPSMKLQCMPEVCCVTAIGLLRN
jgi:hypothetical protein